MISVGRPWRREGDHRRQLPTNRLKSFSLVRNIDLRCPSTQFVRLVLERAGAAAKTIKPVLAVGGSDALAALLGPYVHL